MTMEDDFLVRIELLNMLGQVIDRDKLCLLKTNDLVFHRFSNINKLNPVRLDRGHPSVLGPTFRVSLAETVEALRRERRLLFSIFYSSTGRYPLSDCSCPIHRASKGEYRQL